MNELIMKSNIKKEKENKYLKLCVINNNQIEIKNPKNSKKQKNIFEKNEKQNLIFGENLKKLTKQEKQFTYDNNTK